MLHLCYTVFNVECSAENAMSHVGIGRAIAWARQASGMTLSQLAEFVDCDRSTIWRIERGDNDPSWTFVQKCAACFNQSVASMQLGVLPVRLSALSAEEDCVVKKSLARVKGAKAELSAALTGLALPSERVLRVLAKCLTGGNIEALLYGEVNKLEAVSKAG